MAIDKAISYRQQAAFGGIMGRDGRRMYGGGSDMGSVADSQGNVGPGTGGYQGGPQGGYGDAGSSNNPSGDRYRSSRRETQQAINNAAAIEAAKKAKEKRDKRDAKNKNITKFGYNKPKSKLGGILGTIAGMMMGIPGLGLLTGGLGSLKNKFNDVTNNPNDLSLRERLTGYKTQKEYDDARRDRQLQGRLDNMYDRKSKGKNFSQKNMDMLESMGLQPSTAQNVLTGRDLKGFTPSRMGLQTTMTPMAKPTFSDPFANTVGTTTKVNAPASDAVSSYSYGTADAAIPGVETTTPSYINEFLNKPRTPGKSSPFSNFIDGLYNPEQIAALENEYGSKYGITNTSGGISSDARHMAAMNNLSNSLSPFNNKFGNFIGDTGAFAAGLINELPALGRGFNKQNLGEIGEDIAANFRGSFGTPNQTTAEQIYGDVFEGSTPARTASVPTYGTASAEDITIDGGMFNSPFMENQIGPRVIAAENAYYNQGKMPPEFLGDRLRMNMELGNARGFMGPGFAQGGLASMFTRRG